MACGRTSSLLLAVALLLLVPEVKPRGYRGLAGFAKHHFAGLRKQRLSGLGRHAAAVADSIRAAGPQPNDSDGDDYKPALDNYEPRRDRLPRRRIELKQLLRHQQHHKKMMAKNKRLNGRNEICLFKALRRCGNHLITELSSEADFDHRCSSKEDFLDCMSRMQHGSCHVKHVRHGPSRALVQQYQQRLRRLLRATRGCVIGVDLSTDTD